MKEIRDRVLSGERALFQSKGLKISDTIFENGESSLKECHDIDLERVTFKWKYPLWYSSKISVRNSAWLQTARAGVWYSNKVTVDDCMCDAPKTFRRCNTLAVRNTSFSDASETLWSCRGVELKNVTAHGDYFAMNSENMKISGLHLFGNYSFDGCKNVEMRDSQLIIKDAFWNSENVTVYNSFISGEYLGWNSKNLTLVNCTIESLQGLCYIENLVMKKCRLINTTLAFEYSEVDADISSGIESVLNPKSGIIRAQRIGELIIEKDKINPAKTKIVCNDVEKRIERAEWSEEYANV